MKFTKKILLLLLLTLSLYTITGCTNKAFDDAINEGKRAVASNNLETAKEMFVLALEEKPKNEEAKALYNQTTKLIEATNLKEDDVEKSKTICEEVLNIETNSDIVKNKAKILLEEINAIIESNNKLKSQTQEKISKIESTINNSEYETAKEELNSLKEEIIKDEKVLADEIQLINDLINKCNEQLELLRQEEEAEAKKNNPVYPMTEAKALEILSNKYPEYTYLGNCEIDYETINGISEAAYVFTFINDETRTPYAGWVFRNGEYKLKPIIQD